jgi:16S rRNA C1402 (ribose-2'-O) methylase RsmI
MSMVKKKATEKEKDVWYDAQLLSHHETMVNEEVIARVAATFNDIATNVENMRAFVVRDFLELTHTAVTLERIKTAERLRAKGMDVATIVEITDLPVTFVRKRFGPLEK